MSGCLCNIAADRSWTVRDVKAAIEAEAGVIRQEQRLLSSQVELGADSRLSTLPAGDVVDLILVRRLPEQAEWLAKVQDDWMKLSSAPRWATEDREIVLAAVQQHGGALNLVAEKLLADREIILAAVAQDGHALMYASQELVADREVALAAVQQNGLALNFVAEELRADREIVLAAVRQDGHALMFAAEELQVDRQIVSAVMQEDACSEAAASAELARRAMASASTAPCWHQPVPGASR